MVPFPATVRMLLTCCCAVVVAAGASSASPSQTCPRFSSPVDADNLAHQSVISDIQSSLSSVDSTSNDQLPTKITSAINDFEASTSNDGKAAYAFLRGLATSPTFLDHYWHRRPLLIRSTDITTATTGNGNNGNNNNWVSNAFTLEQHLKLIDGSYINGHRTADILRNGTRTDTWEFTSIKSNPARQTTWTEVEAALKDGTIYFNTAGSLWPNLGALCRLAGYAFGLPTNVNVYVTPPGVTTSVPPHTDRQDVLCFQTQGAKRWRVYAPPPRKQGVDPLNRGKGGDVLSFDTDLGEPLIDAVVEKGDVLFVPTGFPHTTDTVTVVGGGDGEDNAQEQQEVFNETSIHLTMGLDSNVWGLTFAHLRWSLLQRSRKEFKMEIKTDEAYWNAMETMPIGFLGGNDWEDIARRLQETGELDEAYVSTVTEALKEVMIELEPERWNIDGSDGSREDLPSDQEFAEVITYMVKEHALALMGLQDGMFSDIDPHRDDTIMKAYECTQKQNAIMEDFGKYSNNKAMEQTFAKSRAERDLLTKKANDNMR